MHGQDTIVNESTMGLFTNSCMWACVLWLKRTILVLVIVC